MTAWDHIRQVAEPERARFLEAMDRPRQAQGDVLRTILQANQTTEFGCRYSFETIADVDAYRARVPVHRYEDFGADIGRMANGERDVLVSEDVELYEETSGSASAPKLIPYTANSLAAFQSALFPWLADLTTNRPRITNGRCYWAISPAARNAKTTSDGTPIGVHSDAAYFGENAGTTFASLSAVPPELSWVQDMETWRYLTVRFLLNAHDLSVISIWSPTFLFPLLETLKENKDSLVAAVAEGTTGCALPTGTERIGENLKPEPARAKVVEQALAQSSIDTAQLWPHLDIISCWADASSRAFLAELEAAFPHVEIQGKGLLSTEGAVSLPLTSFHHPVLAANSGFFEFLDCERRSNLCHEIVKDQTYRLIMTTPGGLYRYDTGDYVRMQGWAKGLPMLSFEGRGDKVSDLVGEKLSEHMVLTCLSCQDGFAMLAPTKKAKPHYILYVDANSYSQQVAYEMAERLDATLIANPQYGYARRLGQLGAIEAKRAIEPAKTYVAFSLSGGQKYGDIKLPALSLDSNWDDRFVFASPEAAE